MLAAGSCNASYKVPGSFPTGPQLELGPPIASWAFLGRACGEQRGLGQASLQICSPEHREVWGGESGGQASPSVGRTSRARYGAGCGDIGVSEEHPDSQRALCKEQEKALESRSKARCVRGWGSV